MNRDIAIIGMSARFPGGNDFDKLVEDLKAGKDYVRDISHKRRKDTTLDPNRPLRQIGFLEDIDKFDHQLFNLSLAEAQTMDPNHRLLLESVYETFENAGYHPDDYQKYKTSVYVSDVNPEYYQFADEFLDTMVSGNSPAFIATRISRHFNLTGNAAVVDTACSSSLVAVHMACNELIIGDADSALVCGVNLNLTPYQHKELEFNIWSPDSKSRAFSDRANGMSCGELAASILLKPLDKALEDRDNIHAVIKATAVNNNANRSSSPSAPDSISQANVLKDAWKKAGIHPEDMGYIEAHGSGTSLGDSLEIEALTKAFNEFTDKKQFCPISTIKSNMGHGYNASGLAGLIKATLSLKHKLLFPTVHFDRPNPIIDFENTAVYVNKEVKEWEVEKGRPRYAGVTSLGASGTNCHIVLAEAEPRTEMSLEEKRKPYLFTISSKTEKGLKRNLKALRIKLANADDSNLKDISFTLNKGRKTFLHRKAFVADTVNSLRNQIDEWLTTEAFFQEEVPEKYKTIFLLNDHEHDQNELINHLMSNHKEFTRYYEACLKWSTKKNKAINDFSVQYSLLKVLESYGIASEGVIAVGIGKQVLSCLQDRISLEEAVKQASEYQGQAIENIDQRVHSLLARETADQPVQFLELGPISSLSARIQKANSTAHPHVVIAPHDDKDLILFYMKELFERGQFIDWEKYYSHHSGDRIELPTYQFERTRCWIREEPLIVSDQSQTNQKETIATIKLENQENETEFKIATYWSEILGVRELDVADNFFELGGDSLLATQLIKEIKEHYQIPLDFEDIFDFPTIKEISEFINSLLTTERQLSIIFKEVLKLKNVDAKDNFFDLGGHSLMANQVLVRIYKALNVQLNFEEIFKHPTPCALADYIDQKAAQPALASQHIEVVKEQEDYDVSPTQMRMWLLSQMDEAALIAYNSPFSIELEGELDIDSFRQALFFIIKRHESLRTIFITKNGEPRQKILQPEEVSHDFEVIDVRAQNQEYIQSILEEDKQTAFDLSEGPLLRTKLFLLDEKKMIVYLNVHHIVSDGWSSKVFLHELIVQYNSLQSGEKSPLQPLRIQYKDYSAWQNQVSQDKELKSYWEQQLSGEITTLELPLDYSRPPVQTFDGGKVQFTINKETTAKLKTLCRQHDLTLFMALLTSTNILMHKYSGQSDILIGSPIAGRQHIDLENQIGFYANTLVFRTMIEKGERINDLFKQVRETTLGGYQHQLYPFDQLVRDLDLNRDMSQSPLFNVMLVLQNTDIHAEPTFLKDLKFTKFEDLSDSSLFDLHFEFIETGEELTANLTYNKDLFSSRKMEAVGDHFRSIVEQMIKDSAVTIKNVTILTDDEWYRERTTWNQTAYVYENQKSVYQRFMEQSEKNPDKIAAIYKDNQITYSELNERSSQLAQLLRKKGIQANDVVGIMVERSIEMLVGIYGIIKAGAAYLPIDPDYPQERIRHMIDNSGAKMLLTLAEYRESHQSLQSLEWILLDSPSSYWIGEPYEPINYDPNSLAYVIYTSGSTGKPKGVMIEHASLVNRLNWMQRTYPNNEHDVILHKTPFVFDVSVWEIFWWSITGSTVVILENGLEKDPQTLMNIIQQHQVTNIHFVPTMLNAFLDYVELVDRTDSLSSLKQVFASGEELHVAQVRKFNSLLWKVNESKLINLYGPTEATIDVSHFLCSTGQNLDKVPIGLPIDNLKLYVLNEGLQIQPVGIIGELYISGIGLARGYINNEELTEERFFPSPFDQGERLYKTGDLVKRLPDGNILYIGRTDDQVKINGYRIELEEITNQLLIYESILDAVVLTTDRNEIAAVFSSIEVIDSSDITRYLKKSLPNYMIPSKILRVESIPTTRNGKTDRNSLIEVLKTYDNFNRNIEKARTSFEETLIQVWTEVLQVEEIGISNHFFELGGDSIKALRASIALQKEGIMVELKDIYLHPTIKELSKVKDQIIMSSTNLTDRKAQVNQLIQQLTEIKEKIIDSNLGFDIEDAYPMSDIERGLIFNSIANDDSSAHLIQYVYQARYKDFNVLLFKDALKEVVRRHDNLKASFNMKDFNVPVKLIHKDVQLNVGFTDLTLLLRDQQKAYIKDFMNSSQQQPFDFEKPQLWNLQVFSLGQGQFLFVFKFHQAIMDGWSNSILMREISETYFSLSKGKLLSSPKLASNYKQFIIDQMVEKRDKTKLEFWKNELAGYKRLDFHTSHEGSTGAYLEKHSYHYHFGRDLLQRTKGYAKEHALTIKGIFFGIYTKIINQLFNQQDVVVGLLTHNRPICEDSDKMIGFFINLVPVRVQFEAFTSWTTFFHEINIKLNQLTGYDRIPLSEIAKAIDEQNVGENPITDTIFNFTDFHESRSVENTSERLEDHEKLSIDSISNTNNTLLDFNVDVSFDEMVFKIDSAILSKELIDLCMEYFEDVLTSIATNPELKVSDVPFPNQLKASKTVIPSIDFDF
ncbi:amino acid adenylation domain-containing protein [Mesobacillus maritimus]|uniref:non-ribosomal peptide synthetase n=1 Tax=Mesobacillus maritimus TaxID=1643336 RepID=UPI00203C5597|nr:non-ribosomal peptide synthetase [Mesobacillus maritimus]MCM3670701.1 amino acid adenylation domain-containing protein [Mesobacillus maritimus]